MIMNWESGKQVLKALVLTFRIPESLLFVEIIHNDVCWCCTKQFQRINPIKHDKIVCSGYWK